MVVCLYLILSGKFVRVNTGEHAQTEAAAARRDGLLARLPILKLALVMLMFDFSAYLIRPFFALYWQAMTGSDSELVSGMAFAIPGVVAIVALRLQAWIRARGGHLPDHTVGNLLLGAVGLLLHAASDPVLIVLGRVLYGWAFFQIIVKLEVNLFRLSTPQRYANDYAITNFFQNMGVLLSSFAAGAIVKHYGLHVPFLLAAAGFVFTALLDRLILKVPSAGHLAQSAKEAHPTPLEETAHVH
jgi:predicted MFS family arabinose efflux permease